MFASPSPSSHPLSRFRTLLLLVFLVCPVCAEQTWRVRSAASSVGGAWFSSPQSLSPGLSPLSRSPVPRLTNSRRRLPEFFSPSSKLSAASPLSLLFPVPSSFSGSPLAPDFSLPPCRRRARCPLPLFARKPKPKAEKRARNFQRAFEEREKATAREAKRRLLLQRQWFKQQEEEDRQREAERLELTKNELPAKPQHADTPQEPRGTDTPQGTSSASTGSRTLTELVQQAISSSGQALKHRENWVVVGSTQRKARRRDRLPYSQREFVRKVFSHLSEEDLEKEVKKAERAWRGDMLLDELEEEIGGPDALAPGGGAGGFVR